LPLNLSAIAIANLSAYSDGVISFRLFILEYVLI